MLVITAIIYSLKAPARAGNVSGAALIQGLDPETIQKISIRSGAAAVTLTRSSSGFTVDERGNYPASVKKLNELIINCLEMTKSRKVTTSAKSHKELGVEKDSADAVVVAFLGAEDKRLVGLVKGKDSTPGSSVYVRLIGEDVVYESEQPLYIDTEPTDYLETKLISINQKDIKRVEVKTPKGSYAISRDSKADIFIEDMPKGKRAKGNDYEDVFNALNDLDCSDVLPEAQVEAKWDTTYTSRQKSGLSYTVQLAKTDDGKYYAKLSAKGPTVGDITITQTESEEGLKKKEALLLANDEAKAFAPRHAGWAYEISSFKANNMRKSLSDIIEDIPKGEEATQIEASHILIAYEGASRSDAKRTKKQAKTRAEMILKKAQAKKADFAQLAKEYSDGPSKVKGGYLGKFGRGAMDKGFEEAAFKLNKGQVSGVVETPFGFHIIKRTK
jgi:hypothetical protein